MKFHELQPEKRPPLCLDCGYRLDHLDTNRCPECGRGFDLSDFTTFTREPVDQWQPPWWLGVLLSLAVMPGIVWLSEGYGQGMGDTVFLGMITMAGGLLGWQVGRARTGLMVLVIVFSFLFFPLGIRLLLVVLPISSAGVEKTAVGCAVIALTAIAVVRKRLKIAAQVKAAERTRRR